MTTYPNDLANKYSKYVKLVRNRIVEVEFTWFQSNPYQSYRLRLTEEQFCNAQCHVRSKKLTQISFEDFVELISPIFANEGSEISSAVIFATFDGLFDQNSNGSVDKDEFESIFILLHGWMGKKRHFSDEHFRSIFSSSAHFMSFQEFYNCVKFGYLREFFMTKD